MAHEDLYLPGETKGKPPGGPAVQLPLGPAAEFEELLPVLLKEVQHPGNGCLLVGIGVPEGLPTHVDMEAAGAGLVGKVAHADGLPEEGLPGHFGAVVAEGHGMGHQFKAVIQGTVVLAVELGLALVGDGQEAAGVVAVLAGLVDLQLHAEIKGPIPPRNRGMGGSSREWAFDQQRSGSSPDSRAHPRQHLTAGSRPGDWG